MNTEFAYEGRPKSEIQKSLAYVVGQIVMFAHKMEKFELKEYRAIENEYRYQLAVITANEVRYNHKYSA